MNKNAAIKFSAHDAFLE